MSQPDQDDVAMRVAAVLVDPDTKSPVLVLRAVLDSALYLPIFIGHLEGTAIATFIAGMDLPRPMTHDLFINTLAETGWTLTHITVTRLEDKTFYAELTVTDADGDTRLIDSRPSDGIALALRASAGIFVARPVLEVAGGRAPEEPEDAEALASGDIIAVPPGLTSPAASEDPVDPGETPMPIFDENTDLEQIDPELFSKYKM